MNTHSQFEGGVPLEAGRSSLATTMSNELVTEASRPVGEELEVERVIILLPRLLRGNCWW